MLFLLVIGIANYIPMWFNKTLVDLFIKNKLDDKIKKVKRPNYDDFFCFISKNNQIDTFLNT